MMNLFKKFNPKWIIFNFDAKEEPAIFLVDTDLFKSLPQDYRFFDEMKYHLLFDKDHETNADAENYLDSSFKWASHEILRNEISLEHSFISIDFKTDNVAQPVLVAHDFEMILFMGDVKIWKVNAKFDDHCGRIDCSKIYWDYNQTTQWQTIDTIVKPKRFFSKILIPKEEDR